MNLHVGCQLEHDTEADAHAVALVEPHSSVQDTIVEERWDSAQPAGASGISTATSAARFDLTPGALALQPTTRPCASRPSPRRCRSERDVQHRVEELPPSSCTGSCRAGCASPTPSRTRPGSCSATRRAAPRAVQAVCDWIHDNVEYGVAERPDDDRRRDLRAPRRHVPRLRAPRRRRSAARSASPPATCSATCPTSASPARSRPWTSTPGSRSGSAIAGGRSTRASTRRASAACRSGAAATPSTSRW